ncbi:MAG: glycoside hydrolase family 43 protein [Lachnospiraceae bacterium]|nr:glycoside hydrolase family 43 protein [Lachnospiraceae bacterium]
MEKYSAYLMVHFTQEHLPDGEQIYFSLSRDGLHWKDVRPGHPMVRLTTGECGVRDPFLLRGEMGDGFYLIATELRIANGRGWEAAQYAGSRNIVVFHSNDLVHWDAPSLVKVGIDGAGCVWAPEAIYDREHDAYLVYWASMVREPGETRAKQRIYCGLTKDFQSFYGIQKYLERPDHVIDMTMLYDEGIYYRFYKDETKKCILADYSTSLWGGEQSIHDPVLDSLMGVEGPIVFRMDGDEMPQEEKSLSEGKILSDREILSGGKVHPDEEGLSDEKDFSDREIHPDEKVHPEERCLQHKKKYCFMADRFLEGKGYLPVLTEDLKSGPYRVLQETEFDLGSTLKRHGGVARITEEEYERLAELT